MTKTSTKGNRSLRTTFWLKVAPDRPFTDISGPENLENKLSERKEVVAYQLSALQSRGPESQKCSTIKARVH